MNTQVDILLCVEIFGVPVILIIIGALILWVPYMQDKKRKTAHEKVVELTEKGHDAKLCPKCNGKGGIWGDWTNCPECGGLGYIYKLRESEEGQPNADNKVELKKCANCGATIGKLEKTYLFEGQTVCGQCNQKLKNQS